MEQTSFLLSVVLRLNVKQVCTTQSVSVCIYSTHSLIKDSRWIQYVLCVWVMLVPIETNEEKYLLVHLISDEIFIDAAVVI